MAKPQRQSHAGTFFITTSCWNRRRLFQVDRNTQLFVDTLMRYRTYFHLHAYVAMPDHVHLLLTPKDVTLERCMQYIKGGFSRTYSLATDTKSEIWQRGFTDHRIRDAHDFENHRKYIEQNPVADRLCAEPKDYPWSSASGLAAMDGYPVINAAPSG